ncbi:MAG: biotin/lipoyl-containing protein, partial [Ardenticatenaceae bacterium]
MAIAVKMPQLGESVTEGTVGSWLKQVGDQVEKYEPLLEVISDKVDTEITATDSGTLLSIEVEEGETVPVGTVLCYLGEEGEAVGAGDGRVAEAEAEAAVEAAPAAKAETPAAAMPAEEEAEAAPEPAREPAVSPPPIGEAAKEAAEADAEEAPPAAPAARGGPPITPVVARMIGEHDIDISQVTGSGRDGRVTKRDVEAYLEARAKEP